MRVQPPAPEVPDLSDAGTAGFIGLGRLGSALARRLREAGQDLLIGSRGRRDALVEAGARMAGEGSCREVAEAASVLFTCLPSAKALEGVVVGPEGILEADGTAPVVVEMTTCSIETKARVRERLVERGGDLLDAPVSGTPAMAAAGIAVIYASGDRSTYDRVEDQIRAMSPGAAFVGALGDGLKVKYVANVLSFVHLGATAEAMALATKLGLDLHMVSALLSKSPGAASGQFVVRSPMIADEQFAGRLVTVEQSIEVLEQIIGAADAAEFPIPLVKIVSDHMSALSSAGYGGHDPAVLAPFLIDRAPPPDAGSPPSPIGASDDR